MTDLNSTFVSVVIPTYNHAHFLGRALQSVLDQTYTNWEAIVIDNHSTDNTDEVVQSFADPRIALLKIQNNGVIAASRNMGIRAAKGGWVAFLDSDDWWTADKLKVCLEHSNEKVDLIYHDLELISEDRRRAGMIRSWQVQTPVTRDLLLRGNAVATSSVIVRTAILEQIGGMSEAVDLIACEDYNTWLHISSITEGFLYVPESLGYYTDHALSASRNDVSDAFEHAMHDFFYLLSTVELAQLKSKIHYKKARALFLAKNYSLALSYLPLSLINASFQQKIRAIFMIVYSRLMMLF